jgi:hypothetical protein
VQVKRKFLSLKNYLFMNEVLTVESFERLDGWNRANRAISGDSRVKAALAITGADLEDIAQDALERLLENFADVVAECPSTIDPAKYLVGRAVYFAENAARSVKNGYHSRESRNANEGGPRVVPIHHNHESDYLTEDGTYACDGLFGFVEQNADICDLVDHLGPESKLKEFGTALLAERDDLLDYWVDLMLGDRKTIPLDKRKELGRNYLTFKRTGKLPVSRTPHPGPTPPWRLPASVQGQIMEESRVFDDCPEDLYTIPADAEVLGLSADKLGVKWTSPHAVEHPLRSRTWIVIRDPVMIDGKRFIRERGCPVGKERQYDFMLSPKNRLFEK